jgi:hypothetical protein
MKMQKRFYKRKYEPEVTATVQVAYSSLNKGVQMRFTAGVQQQYAYLSEFEARNLAAQLLQQADAISTNHMAELREARRVRNIQLPHGKPKQGRPSKRSFIFGSREREAKEQGA